MVSTARILALFLLFSQCAGGQMRPVAGSGTISGTVADEHGSPLADAVVLAVARGGRPTGTLVPRARTDVRGRFEIRHVPWGTYEVFGMKQVADYPATQFTFYGETRFPRVTLSPGTPLARVQLRLGPKAAALEGRVADAVTGSPVNSTFKLMRASPPHDWFSTGQPPRYRVLLPPSTGINVEVHAPGYRTAHYSDIKLTSGSEKRLDVLLIPLKPEPRKKQ